MMNVTFSSTTFGEVETLLDKIPWTLNSSITHSLSFPSDLLISKCLFLVEYHTLKLGLYFSIYPLLLNLFQLYHAGLSQHASDFVGIILCFIVLYSLFLVPPSIKLFNSFYNIKLLKRADFWRYLSAHIKKYLFEKFPGLVMVRKFVFVQDRDLNVIEVPLYLSNQWKDTNSLPKLTKEEYSHAKMLNRLPLILLKKHGVLDRGRNLVAVDFNNAYGPTKCRYHTFIQESLDRINY